MNKEKKLKFLIGAGGTGGHLYPALAVVDEIKRLRPDSEFYFCGRKDKIEGKVVAENGYNFIELDIIGISKTLSFNTLKAVIKLQLAKSKISRLIKTIKIDATICTGAYISIPPGKASATKKIPLFLMESNVNPGKAIKMLANISTNIFTSYNETKSYFSQKNREKVLLTGNPVRKNIINIDNQELANEKFDFNDEKKVILIFGGSLGAEKINIAIENIINELALEFNIVWQTGNDYHSEKILPNNVKQVKYIDNMAEAYSIADLVICRSGATTVAELCITSKPAILIPLETASCNEQENNAKMLSEKSAAFIVKQSKLKDENYLLNFIKDLFNSNKLEIAKKSLKLLAKPESANLIAKEILNYLEN